MFITLEAVVVDGSAATCRRRTRQQRIEVPRGEKLRVQLRCLNQDGGPADISGAAIVLTVRADLAAAPLFVRDAVAVPETTDLAIVTVDGDDTIGIPQDKTYLYDVQLTDADGDRHQVVPVSQFHVLPIVGLVGEVPAEPLVDED